MENATIARPYAQAAFEVACDEDALNRWAILLKRLDAIISDPLMREVIGNPKLEPDRLAGLIIAICGEAAFDSGKSLIRLLVTAGRLGVMREISSLFEKKRLHHVGLSEVKVLSAFALSDEQKSFIQKIMSKKLGGRVEINSQADPELIGGIVVRVGDSVVDASLRGRLFRLTNELTS